MIFEYYSFLVKLIIFEY